MAMRAVNPLGQQGQHRASKPAVIFSALDCIAPTPVLCRSSCSARGPCRLSQRFPSRCSAIGLSRSPPLWSIGTNCEDVMVRLRETGKLKNCLGAPLTDEEQRSLIKCLDSARLGVDTCLVDGLEALRNHMMSYIEAVAISQTDDLELVEGAMLLIEQLSLALGSTDVYPTTTTTRRHGTTTTSSSSEEASEGVSGHEEQGGQRAVEGRFVGQFQVLVTTGGGWPYGRLHYVPIIELLEISEDGETFRLESKAGPLYMYASGEVMWRPGCSHHLHYHATDFRVELLGASLKLPSPAPDNDLRVFALAPSTALARSSLGGMQVMGRPG